MSRKFISVLMALAFAGCAAEVDSKGTEDDLPLDGAADSFRSPTEHGELPFDFASGAELGPDARFHAWEFSLTGDASVAIDVASANPNLDTVAYLYHRTDDSER